MKRHIGVVLCGTLSIGVVALAYGQTCDHEYPRCPTSGRPAPSVDCLMVNENDSIDYDVPFSLLTCSDNGCGATEGCDEIVKWTGRANFMVCNGHESYCLLGDPSNPVPTQRRCSNYTACGPNPVNIGTPTDPWGESDWDWLPAYP
jgi:hypothetical protein